MLAAFTLFVCSIACLFACLFADSVVGGCSGSGWKEVDGSCFKQATSFQLSWVEARSECLRLGGDLATFDDDSDNRKTITDVLDYLQTDPIELRTGFGVGATKNSKIADFAESAPVPPADYVSLNTSSIVEISLKGADKMVLLCEVQLEIIDENNKTFTVRGGAPPTEDSPYGFALPHQSSTYGRVMISPPVLEPGWEADLAVNNDTRGDWQESSSVYHCSATLKSANPWWRVQFVHFSGEVKQVQLKKVIIYNRIQYAKALKGLEVALLGVDTVLGDPKFVFSGVNTVLGAPNVEVRNNFFNLKKQISWDWNFQNDPDPQTWPGDDLTSTAWFPVRPEGGTLDSLDCLTLERDDLCVSECQGDPIADWRYIYRPAGQHEKKRFVCKRLPSSDDIVPETCKKNESEVESACPCDSVYVTAEEQCVHVSETKMNYFNAQQYCAKRGEFVATVKTAETEAEIMKKSENQTTWIGLESYDNGFQWDDRRVIQDGTETWARPPPVNHFIFESKCPEAEEKVGCSAKVALEFSEVGNAIGWIQANPYEKHFVACSHTKKRNKLRDTYNAGWKKVAQGQGGQLSMQITEEFSVAEGYQFEKEQMQELVEEWDSFVNFKLTVEASIGGVIGKALGAPSITSELETGTSFKMTETSWTRTKEVTSKLFTSTKSQTCGITCDADKPVLWQYVIYNGDGNPSDPSPLKAMPCTWICRKDDKYPPRCPFDRCADPQCNYCKEGTFDDEKLDEIMSTPLEAQVDLQSMAVSLRGFVSSTLAFVFFVWM